MLNAKRQTGVGRFVRGVRFAVCWSVAVGAVVAEPIKSRWEQEIAAIEAREKAEPPGDGAVLFTGSSSIRLWQTLAPDFPEVRVINRGFGGSQVSDLIAYFDRVVRTKAPRQVVIYSGTNDLNAKKSPEHVMADVATLCGMIRVALPGTRISLISAAPNPARWDQRAEQEAFNAMVKAYATRYGHDYIDVWTPMLGEDGMPSRDLYVADKLHMNEAGYVLWREVVEPFLIMEATR